MGASPNPYYTTKWQLFARERPYLYTWCVWSGSNLLGKAHADSAGWRRTLTEENNTAFLIDPLYGFNGHRLGTTRPNLILLDPADGVRGHFRELCNFSHSQLQHCPSGSCLDRIHSDLVFISIQGIDMRPVLL